jgi:glycosyltransferase involved in cell wall biosynthesis
MHITVCVCTRDRGSSIATTLRSLLASHYDDFDVIIVDQSVSDESGICVRAIVGGDPRFHYRRSATIGASRARNVANSQARGPVIAFTDDDCEVAPDWLYVIASTFAARQDVSVLCGGVRAGPYDPKEGFIPTYRPRQERLVRSPWLKWRESGILANMAIRQETLKQVGAFDEILGPGAPLPNCEDGDMMYRVLRMGGAILTVPDAVVTHHGFRTFEEGKTVMPATSLGVGAAYMKHLRLGDVAIAPTLLIEWMRCIHWGRLLTLRRHNGVRRFFAYARGMGVSFHYPIDRATRVYREPSADGTATRAFFLKQREILARVISFIVTSH